MALWSSVTLGRVFDSALTVSISGANNLSLTVDQAVAREITFTGALTGNVAAVFPVVSTDAGALWLLTNSTSGAFTLAVQAATGASVTLAQNKRMLVLWTGTDFVPLISDVAAMGAAASGANADITSLAAISSGITAYGGLNIGDAVKGNSAQSKAFQFGRLTKALSDANTTLAANEYVNPVMEFTGTLTAQRNVVVPLTDGAVWFVFNNGTGQGLQFIGATGTGIVVANNKRAVISSDGTNIVRYGADV